MEETKVGPIFVLPNAPEKVVRVFPASPEHPDNNRSREAAQNFTSMKQPVENNFQLCKAKISLYGVNLANKLFYMSIFLSQATSYHGGLHSLYWSFFCSC